MVARKDGQITSVARIVVHDRSKVETTILPRYFNHASFASLRRQLNYFAFSRLGKGRQKGATYCNNQVADLRDILRLKRRVVSNSSAGNEKNRKECRQSNPETLIETSHDLKKSTRELISQGNLKKVCIESVNSDLLPLKRKVTKIIHSVVPVVHLPTYKKRKGESISQPMRCNSPSRYTKTRSNLLPATICTDTYQSDCAMSRQLESKNQKNSLGSDNAEKSNDDVLAGCNALLSLGLLSSN